MSFPDAEPPPAKKRRFFADSPSPSPPRSSDDLHAFGIQPSLPDGLHTPTSDRRDPAADIAFSEDIATDGASSSAPGFDVAMFEAFVGESVAPSTVKKLRHVAGDDMQRAINMYLDGSWKSSVKTGSQGTITASLATRSTQTDPSGADEQKPSSSEPKTARSNMLDLRYVGAFGVGGWATRSGKTLLSHGEPVRIERQKIQPPAPKKGGKATALSKRTDIIVRFTNRQGEELGRLPKETAAWVSTLVDQRVCKFEGICVYAPDHVRINDTIYLQLRCSLLKTAFEAAAFKPLDNNRVTGLFEEKESTEEKELRLRQIALVTLFDEINLHPIQASDAAVKHKRQGLLQAAESSEIDKARSQENGGSSPSEEEAEDGKELEQDQLDTLYKKAQSFDFGTPAAEPADTFAMNLRHYQKQALHWMMSKEKDEKNSDREVSMHPLWEEYLWPTKDVDDKELPTYAAEEKFYVNPYSGELSLDFPIQEQNCLGGVLADEMGLGKTIEMLSLVHSHRSATALAAAAPGSARNLPRLPKRSSAVEAAPCTTLVVAPMSLLAQWQSEAENASKAGTMKSIVYYGSDKSANLQALCCEANAAAAPHLVITSYGVVLSEFNQVAASSGNRGSHGGLFSLDFFRVILDEAHHIKNRQSKTAKACYEISATHRWVLTGTPIVNRLEDLFSLVRFLRVEPWSNFSFWKTFITVPFESKDFIRALDVVQTVLEPLVLRRTKDMKTPDGTALVALPPKTIEIEEVELSKPEREVYDHIFTRAKRTFAANVEAGTLLKSYTTIFAQILRLRQSCCHPVLTRNKNIVAEEEDAAAAADIANGLGDDMDLQSLIERFTAEEEDGEQDIANRFGAHVLRQIQDESGNECPICTEEPMIEQAVTGCWHSACKKCLLAYIEHQKDKHSLPRCFNCREAINQRDIFEVVRHDDLYSGASAEGPNANERITLRRIGSHSSAKIAALLSHLKRPANRTTKSVVFSQFTSFLDLIEPALARDHIPYLRFDGSMAQKARAAVLAQFAAADPATGDGGKAPGTVLLLSLRAGGVGLNLTQAKRVFMMDPWWSFAVEAQAIDRVHRMGQVDEVGVVRFIVRDSVEHRMLRIQERKKFIASSLGMMSDEEKKMQRIEDIKELLS